MGSCLDSSQLRSLLLKGYGITGLSCILVMLYLLAT